MAVINGRYRLSDNIIGKGGFGVVYLGKDLVDGKDVAIKSVNINQKSMLNASNKQKLEQEIALMSTLSHENIVKYYDSYKSSTHWYIIMEYCNYGTLADYIKDVGLIGEREDKTRYYLKQLKEALKYLRSHEYVHRDIKPANILLTKVSTTVYDSDSIFGLDEDLISIETIVIKLADFGLSKSTHTECIMSTVCGSPLFMAPEVLKQQKYSIKADLWSFGMVMYQMLIGKPPHDSKTMDQLKTNVDIEIDFHREHGFSEPCYDLLSRLLEKNSNSRLDWEQLFDHEWFDKIVDQPIKHNIDFTSQIGVSKPPSKLGSSNLSKMKFISSVSFK